jgi:hypothetical protein
MKNTYIPLDMIFIDSSGEIVGIAEKTNSGLIPSLTLDMNLGYVLIVPNIQLFRWVAQV